MFFPFFIDCVCVCLLRFSRCHWALPFPTSLPDWSKPSKYKRSGATTQTATIHYNIYEYRCMSLVEMRRRRLGGFNMPVMNVMDSHCCWCLCIKTKCVNLYTYLSIYVLFRSISWTWREKKIIQTFAASIHNRSTQSGKRINAFKQWLMLRNSMVILFGDS